MMGLPWYAMLAAGLVVGGGLMVWVIRRLNQAEADRIEKNANENYNKAAVQAKAMENTVAKAAKEAKDNAKNADPTDW